MTWSTADIPDLTGRRAVLTGVTGGLGLATAVELARHGASLTVTARDTAKGNDYLAQLRSVVPDVDAELQLLDLADLNSTQQAATAVAERHSQIDILINNAGVMIPPKSTTADGFELQMGTNHLGHFAWTATLWPTLKASSARVVTVASLAHSVANGLDLNVFDPSAQQSRYRRWQAYGQSKLANLMFALELDRRAKAAGVNVISVAAHPGYAATNLQGAGLNLGRSRLPGMAMHQISRVLGQPAARGALPSLMAATDSTLTGGEYLGPSGPGQVRGNPKKVGMTKTARNEQLADQLWNASEKAVGIAFAV